MNPLLRALGRLVVLAGGVVVAAVAGREVLRAKPRVCEKCGARMRRLGDGEKQAHLEPGEKCEERVGSVSHDVWRCPECPRFERARWPALVSGATTCGVCRWRTVRVVGRRTLASGVEVTRKCDHCSALV